MPGIVLIQTYGMVAYQDKLVNIDLFGKNRNPQKGWHKARTIASNFNGY